MLYPLFFQPIYKSTLWGGRNLESVFNRELPLGKVAESWDVSCHGDDVSVVLNGNLKGLTLKEVMTKYKNDLLGRKWSGDNFPLLVKLIDANDKLSVQVHPDDDYAVTIEGDMGKTEMWYILQARDGAQIIYGTQDNISPEEFKKAIEEANLNPYLNYVDVKAGDVIYIPSGTVHAILDGILIAEIQQNSATTYRVYDWGRVDKEGNPRDLHVNKALDVINFNYKGEINSFSDLEDSVNLTTSPYFIIDKLKVNERYTHKTDGSTFYIYTVLKGNLKVKFGDEETIAIAGSSFLIPATIGEYEIIGSGELLKTYL